MANSVADILGRLMQKYEIGENALARATGVTQPTIHRILTGESSDPKQVRCGLSPSILKSLWPSCAVMNRSRGAYPCLGNPVVGRSGS